MDNSFFPTYYALSCTDFHLRTLSELLGLKISFQWNLQSTRVNFKLLKQPRPKPIRLHSTLANPRLNFRLHNQKRVQLHPDPKINKNLPYSISDFKPNKYTPTITYNFEEIETCPWGKTQLNNILIIFGYFLIDLWRYKPLLFKKS